MNTALNATAPLPSALRQYRPRGGARRSHIGPYQIDRGALEHFNDLLAKVDIEQPALECDQVASAARELLDQPLDGAPACISQRMRRAAAIDLMQHDPEWTPTAPAAGKASLVVDYMRGRATLIPNSLPVIGRLDDVVVVERAWPYLADEVRDYLDFCLLRRVEAELRHEPRRHFGFTRDDWEEFRRFQAGARHDGLDYVFAAPAVFRVH